MISRINYSLFFILIIFLASCASPGPQKPAGTQKKIAAVVTPVKKISAKNSFAPVFGSRDPRLAWWGLYGKAPLAASKPAVSPAKFDVFNKREFLFDKPEKHDFEKVTARIPMGMKEYSPGTLKRDWQGSGYRILGVLAVCLLASIAWRGLRLIALFFGLWRRGQKDAVFSRDLIATSNLVPPVSLYLATNSSGSELLSQISSVENLDYEEVELIVFRDVSSKDDDAILLKDFRLRFRSPLYFADLDTEDPFEILEVEGERRILLVYSEQKKSRPSLALFLKLARYPLVGFLSEGVTLNSPAVTNLVFRWLRDGEKGACVYGYLDEFTPGPFVWFERQWAFLNGVRDSSIEHWIRQKYFFGLMPKHMAIQLMEFGGGRYQSTLWSELASHEIVGTRKSAHSFFEGLESICVTPVRSMIETLVSGISLKSITLVLDKLSCLLAVVIWPVILASSVIMFLVAKELHVSVLFLMGSEVLLLFLSATAWCLFPKNAIQNISLPGSEISIHEKRQIPA